MSLTICKAQLATAPLQSAGNTTAVVIKKDLDSLQPYFITLSNTLVTLSVTYSNTCVMGTGASGTTVTGLSYTLPSGKYKLIDHKLISEANNYTTWQCVILSSNPTKTCNVAFSASIAEANSTLYGCTFTAGYLAFGGSGTPTCYRATVNTPDLVTPIFSGTFYLYQINGTNTTFNGGNYVHKLTFQRLSKN